MLSLGTAKGKTVSLSDADRATHVHVIGKSGVGKSKLLEQMIRCDILDRSGLCLIDPHGTLADAVLAWTASLGLDRHRPIRVIDASDGRWSAGFNPLRLYPGAEPSVQVDALVNALEAAWGDADMNATPRLRRILRAVFYALAVRELTLAEATTLLSSAQADRRRALTASLPNPVAAATWDHLNSMSRREFNEVCESANNRLDKFLSSAALRRVFGQSRSTLDAGRAMEAGEIWIVNLKPSPTFSGEEALVLGTLLVNEFRMRAMQRDVATASRRPFTLYIDECHKFLTNDIADMLDQTRKFGLHLVLSHQRLGQLRTRSPDIYNAVMAGGQTKIVFQLADEDAEGVVDEIFRSTYDLERPKHAFDRPMVVGERIGWLLNESETNGTSSSHGYSVGESDSASASISTSFGAAEGARGEPMSESETSGSGQTFSASASWSETTSHSNTSGRSQALIPEWANTSTTGYQLEEVRHLAILKMRQLPKRTAIVKRGARDPVRMRVADVSEPLVTPARVREIGERIRGGTPFVARAADADREIAERALGLEVRNPSAPDSDDAFWSA